VAYVIGILSIIIAFLVVYITCIQLQIRNMTRQLNKRMNENTLQSIHLELFNSDLNRLAVKMNQCLKAEENLRLNGIREEKKFRELIADISHDLRTPLTAVKGYLQLLATEELGEEQNRKLQIAQKHTNDLGQLIEQFFEYSYLINTGPRVQMERINLTQLVTECLIASVTAFEEHHLTLCFDEDTPSFFIRADKAMTTRIVQNLIRNCIQHSIGDIQVRLEKEEAVELSLINPVKKSKEIDITRIFDRFYTGDKARSHSTGLGLAIVKLLSEQMGGSVCAQLEGDLLKISVMFPIL